MGTPTLAASSALAPHIIPDLNQDGLISQNEIQAHFQTTQNAAAPSRTAGQALADLDKPIYVLGEEHSYTPVATITDLTTELKAQGKTVYFHMESDVNESADQLAYIDGYQALKTHDPEAFAEARDQFINTYPYGLYITRPEQAGMLFDLLAQGVSIQFLEDRDNTPGIRDQGMLIRGQDGINQTAFEPSAVHIFLVGAEHAAESIPAYELAAKTQDMAEAAMAPDQTLGILLARRYGYENVLTVASAHPSAYDPDETSIDMYEVGMYDYILVDQTTYTEPQGPRRPGGWFDQGRPAVPKNPHPPFENRGLDQQSIRDFFKAGASDQ
mgnify:CR=1 FL=1